MIVDLSRLFDENWTPAEGRQLTGHACGGVLLRLVEMGKHSAVGGIIPIPGYLKARRE